MIRMAGAAALGLMMNACPFGVSERPDGYARVVGQVVMNDGSAYVGRVSFLCSTTWQPQSSLFGDDRADPRGSYAVLLEAPFASRPMQGEPFEFLCRVMAGPRGGPFAIRYVTVPFSPDRRTAQTVRIDLREGEMEPEP